MARMLTAWIRTSSMLATGPACRGSGATTTTGAAATEWGQDLPLGQPHLVRLLLVRPSRSRSSPCQVVARTGNLAPP